MNQGSVRFSYKSILLNKISDNRQEDYLNLEEIIVGQSQNDWNTGLKISEISDRPPLDSLNMSEILQIKVLFLTASNLLHSR